MNGHNRKTPDQRTTIDVSEKDWAIVLDHREYVYNRLRVFGEKVLRRRVAWVGPLGQHQWRVFPPKQAYGADPHALMEDLEYRALEAAVEAVRSFKPDAGLSLKSFMATVIDHKLRNEFDMMTRSVEESEGMISLDDVDPDALSYVDPHDEPDGPDDGLNDETRARLQSAMGALTSREAWALRMKADGRPNVVIAESLGLKGEKSVFKIIAEARRKAKAAYDA